MSLSQTFDQLDALRSAVQCGHYARMQSSHKKALRYKSAGQPLHNALVWMDRRTAAICQRLTKELGSGVRTHVLLRSFMEHASRNAAAHFLRTVDRSVSCQDDNVLHQAAQNMQRLLRPATTLYLGAPLSGGRSLSQYYQALRSWDGKCAHGGKEPAMRIC